MKRLAAVLLAGLAACVSVLPAAQASSQVDAPRMTVAKSSTFTTLAGPMLRESSGLAYVDGKLLTVNDSGDGPVVYAIDRKTGGVAARLTYSTIKPRDNEALAWSGKSLWVADIGDNGAKRETVMLSEIPEPDLSKDTTVTAKQVRLKYPTGPRDAEAFLVHPTTGERFVVSKGLLGGEIYRVPKELSPDRVSQMELVGAGPAFVTDGTFSPDGKFAYLLTPSSVLVHTFPGFQRIATVELPDGLWQPEGITNGPDGTLLVSTEVPDKVKDKGAPVLQLTLPPAAFRDLPAAATPTKGGAATAPGGGETDSAPTLFSNKVLLVAGGAAGAVVLGVALCIVALTRRR